MTKPKVKKSHSFVLTELEYQITNAPRPIYKREGLVGFAPTEEIQFQFSGKWLAGEPVKFRVTIEELE